MEHQPKKRGISLIRHKRSESVQSVSTQNYQEPPMTHFNYPRYPVRQMVVRHASTPKTSVVFHYPINPEGLVPTPLELRHEPSEINAPEKVFTPKAHESYRPQVVHMRDEQPKIQRYVSFEHCKEVIGNRLFGASPKSNKNGHQDRQNRFQNDLKSSSYKNSDRVCPFNEIINMPLGVSSKLNIQTEKDNEAPKIRVLGLSQECVENITIVPQKEPLKVKKSKRGPANLQEMEKRLMEIIKICDDSL